MSKATSDAFESYEQSARTIDELIDEVRGVLEGLRAPRHLDSRAEWAIEATLTVPGVNRVRLGWELVEVLAEGSGFDSDAILPGQITEADRALAREALWAPAE